MRLSFRPVKVRFPHGRDSTCFNEDRMKGERVRLRRLPQKLHTGLLWCPACFPLIARIAARDNVFPGGDTTLLPRYYVVVVQITHGESLTTVLTLEAVTGEDVDTRKLDALLHRGYRVLKLDYRGNEV